VLQCVVVCCSVCCSVCYSHGFKFKYLVTRMQGVLQCVVVCRSVCCSVCCIVCYSHGLIFKHLVTRMQGVLQCVAVCVAVCCSVLQCVLQCVLQSWPHIKYLVTRMDESCHIRVNETCRTFFFFRMDASLQGGENAKSALSLYGVALVSRID